MPCDFMSFSSVFQSYQDDGQVIMKGCQSVRNETLFMTEKISASGRAGTWDHQISRSVLNSKSYRGSFMINE